MLREERNLRIELNDGVGLAANAYFPADAEGPLPALVSYYPYHKDDLLGALFDDVRRYFAEHGYVELLVDFRGTGASEGYCWDTWDAVAEGRDGAEIVEWIAAQPWCDGNVGFWGMSYGGITCFNVAAQQPPHLRACLPLFGSPDIYRDFINPGGVPNAIGNAVRETFMLAMDLAPPTYTEGVPEWRERWRERLRRLEDGDLWSLAWQSHPDYDEHWRRRAPDLAKIEAPTFGIGGWNDIFPDGMVRAYKQISAPSKLVMGPWIHLAPHTSEREPWSWQRQAVRWWDRWLKGERNGIDEEPAVALFVQGEERWRSSDAWPDEELRRFHPAAAGELLDQAPAGPGEDRYRAEFTVGARGALFDPMGVGLGYPPEQALDNLKSLSYTTAPLAEDLWICGSPVAGFTVVLEQGEELDLVAKLSDVAPDGSSAHVATGWLNGRHAAGADAPADPQPGVPTEYRVPLWATSYRIPAGHRLRLSLSCADFPHSFPTATRPQIAVRLGAGTVLELPVAPALASAPDPGLERPEKVGENEFLIRAEPEWRVEEDLGAARLAVTYGTSLDFALPQGPEWHLDFGGVATVDDARPDGAKVDSHAQITVRLGSGELVEVEAKGQFGRRSQLMNGRVTVDGRVLLDRQWANF
jgi:uncharacterized protein